MNTIERSQDNNLILVYLEYINNTQNCLTTFTNLMSQQDNNLRALINRGNTSNLGSRNNNRRSRYQSNPISRDRENIFRAFSNFNNFSRPTNYASFSIPSFTTPVTVRPTEQEISQSTEEIIYSSITNPINDRCPISQEYFNSDSVVTRICHCGHIFNTEHINQWFRTSVICPVCRWDIRDSSLNNVTNPTTTPAARAGNTQPSDASNSSSANNNFNGHSSSNTSSTINNLNPLDSSGINISDILSEEFVRGIVEQGLNNSENITLEYATSFTQPFLDISRNNLNI